MLRVKDSFSCLFMLSVENLQTFFHTREGVVRAVDGVSLELSKGGSLGIVGESGSGKSVTCYSLLRLLPMPPARFEGGSAGFEGRDLLTMPVKELRAIRGRRIGMIFQDPMTSLNPYLRVSTQLTEPLRVHLGIGKAGALDQAVAALQAVGIADAEQRIHSYPHEFSGGMRQRVMIAMALITRPDILIADEPTTALDVTVQKQVLDLIGRRREDLGTAVIFISHDLAVVSGVCDYVHVMYGGRVVEAAPVRELFENPLHAYTRALQRSIPALQEKGKPLYTIPGMPPDLSRPSPGCAFAPRRPARARATCLANHRPELVEASPGHWVQDCPGCRDAGLDDAF